MSFPTNHKTVFVLDRSSNFVECSSQSYDFDILPGGSVPLAPLHKTFWTCSVEAVINYCRIVWDIFTKDKLLRLVVGNSSDHQNSWSQNTQNLHNLKQFLANVGPPVITDNFDISCGLKAAVHALSECSERQHMKRTSLLENCTKIINRGRVICFTSIKSSSDVDTLLKYFNDTLEEQNDQALNSDCLIDIQFCELILVHVCAMNTGSPIDHYSKRKVSPLLTAEIYSIPAGESLIAELNILVKLHYDLLSTLVTKIPMKDEGRANSSAFYDVELMHSASAYPDSFKGSEGKNYEQDKLINRTVVMKWSYQKNILPLAESMGLQVSTSFRVTPVEVTSKPSCCLINFVIKNGLMLKREQKSGSKELSHMLLNHGGDIFIHSFEVGRSPFEDSLGISESFEKSISNYRINDFNKLMKLHRLIPYENICDFSVTPIKKAKRKLLWLTKYWPIHADHTVIFNMPALSPVLSLIPKDTLDADEVNKCKRVIQNLLDCENKNLFYTQMSSSHPKGWKKKKKKDIH